MLAHEDVGAVNRVRTSVGRERLVALITNHHEVSKLIRPGVTGDNNFAVSLNRYRTNMIVSTTKRGGNFARAVKGSVQRAVRVEAYNGGLIRMAYVTPATGDNDLTVRLNRY